MVERKLSRIFMMMILAAVLLSGGCSSSSDDDDGDDGDGPDLRTDACDVLGLKIINGGTCRSDDSPVVRIEVSYTDDSFTACTGTMITDTEVLTAGHCFLDFGENVESIEVLAGGRIVTGTAFAIHPDYSERSADFLNGGAAIFNDVAIIRLGASAGVPILPLFLSRGIQVGDVFSIFGYGIDENGDAGRLESGEMQVDQVPGNHFVSVFDGDGSNTCQGDSGGPAIFTDGTKTGIIGLTSTGEASARCMEGDVSLFANVQDASVLNFISAVVPSVSGI
jgi:trypsin